MMEQLNICGVLLIQLLDSAAEMHGIGFGKSPGSGPGSGPEEYGAHAVVSEYDPGAFLLSFPRTRLENNQ
jgi:hypothetical protein